MVQEMVNNHLRRCVVVAVPLPGDSDSTDLSSVDEELACWVSDCLSIKACDRPSPPSSCPADDELLVMLGNTLLFPDSSSADAEMDAGLSDPIIFEEFKPVAPPPRGYYYSVFFLSGDLDDPELSSPDEELACLVSECLHISPREVPPPPSHFGDIQDNKDEELVWLMSKSLSIQD